jgi:hypothetical protein
VLQGPGLVLGKDDNLTGSFRKSLEQPSTLLSTLTRSLRRPQASK